MMGDEMPASEAANRAPMKISKLIENFCILLDLKTSILSSEISVFLWFGWRYLQFPKYLVMSY